MQIYVGREGDQRGPYSLEQIQQYLAQGGLQLTDSAWYEGLDSWIPLSEVPGVVVAPPRRPIALRPRKKLNKAQKVVLVAGLLVTVAMVYYPPWEGWDMLAEGWYPRHYALETIYGPNVMGSGEGVYSVNEFIELFGFKDPGKVFSDVFDMRFIVISDTYVKLYRGMGGDRESLEDYLGYSVDDVEGEFMYAVTEIAVGRLLFQLLLVSMCVLLLVVTFRGKQGRVDPAGQSHSPGGHRQRTAGRQKKPSFKFKPKS